MWQRQKKLKVRNQAIEIIQVTLKEQYNMINDYAVDLRRSNPGNTVIIQR